MRRPLFGTGIPTLVPVFPTLLKVFDTADFTPQAGAPPIYAVTLFAWAWQNITPVPVLDAPKLPLLGVTVVTNGGTGVAVAQRFPADFTAQQTADLSSYAKPTLLIERFVVRGDQQIFVSNANPVAGPLLPCFVYGYFEAVGRRAPSFPFRPLQPGPLVAPFSAPPTLVALNTPATTSYATAHQLNAAYIDLLDFNTNQGALIIDAPLDAKAFLRLPGNVKLPMPLAVGAGRLLFQAKPFEGQPLIAPSSGDVNISVGFETSGTLIAPDFVAISAYGGFTRR
jgi:hypothetical protein